MKKFFTEHFGWFILTSWLIFCIISITVCFIFVKPMTDEQINYCQEAANNVYAQTTIIYEEPEGVNVNITDTSIEVGMQHARGKVIAKLQNDELVFSYTPQIGEYIFVCVLLGSAADCVFLLFFTILLDRKRRINKKSVSSIQKGPVN